MLDATLAVTDAPPPHRFWPAGRGGARLKRDGGAVVALAGLALCLILALAAPILVRFSPLAQLPDGLGPMGQPLLPSARHWLGTDALGRDEASRLLFGMRTSLAVGLSATLLCGVLGVGVGLVAGYFGGKVDAALMRLTDVAMAFPALLLAVALAAVLPPGPAVVVLVLGAVSWTGLARVIRGLALSLARRDFMEAARAMGASSWTILVRHMLPNVMPTATSLLTLRLADMLLLEAALSYLGLGIRPPAPSWGNMIQEGQEFYRSFPLLVLAPGLAIFVLVLCVNTLGHALAARGTPEA